MEAVAIPVTSTRTSFASLLSHSPILLLDEATSAVDNETVAVIRRSLHRPAHRKMPIVAAHCLSTVVHADRIVVIEHGRVVESGTHAALLRRRRLCFTVERADRRRPDRPQRLRNR